MVGFSYGKSRIINGAGTYIIYVHNECGVARDSIKVDVKTLGKVFIPNVITVNEDGLNDRFMIDQKISEAKIKIYNRYGRLVYESSDYINDFSGQDLSSGAYYYLLQDGCTQDEFKGWLHLIR